MFRVLSSVRIGSHDLSALLIAQWSLLNGLLFLVSFVPSLVNSFARNEEIQLLLSFPIKRRIIVLYQMILTLSVQPFPVVMYLFVFPSYVLASGGNIVLGVISALLFIFLMLSISVLLSSILGLFVGRSVARRITAVGLVITVTLFLLATQFLPSYVQSLVERDPSMLSQGLDRLMHPFNIFSWPVRAIDEPVYALLMLILTLLIVFSSSPIAEKLSFEQVSLARKSKVATFGRGGMIWKDVKLMLRSEQGIFMLLYPLAFGILFGLSLRSFVPAMMISLMLGGSYVAYNSAMLTKQELSIWPLPLVYPVPVKRLLLPKLFAPPTIYSGLFTAMLVFFKVWFSLPSAVLLLVPMMFVTFVFTAALGMFFYLKEPSKAGLSNPSRVLNTTKVLAVQGLTLLTTAAWLLPVQLSLRSTTALKGSTILFMAYATTLACALLLVFLSRKLFARVKQLFEQIE